MTKKCNALMFCIYIWSTYHNKRKVDIFAELKDSLRLKMLVGNSEIQKKKERKKRNLFSCQNKSYRSKSVNFWQYPIIGVAVGMCILPVICFIYIFIGKGFWLIIKISYKIGSPSNFRGACLIGLSYPLQDQTGL